MVKIVARMKLISTLVSKYSLKILFSETNLEKFFGGGPLNSPSPS